MEGQRWRKEVGCGGTARARAELGYRLNEEEDGEMAAGVLLGSAVRRGGAVEVGLAAAERAREGVSTRS